MKAYNPPHQSTLSYRSGTYTTFLKRMLARLPTQTIPSQGGAERPLAALTTRDSDDATMALLDSWAVVGDVLTFYTERIANEGYLRTATEQRSVVALADMIGYQLQPGVAASTSLAFTVEAVDTFGRIMLSPGIQVQSVPGPGQVPQLFETSEELVARAEWNALLPNTSTEPTKQTIDGSTTELRLAGSKTGLQPGDKLLIIGDEVISDPTSDSWYVLTLQHVTLAADKDSTIVTWGGTLGDQKNIDPPTTPRVLALRQQAALFGVNAPRWQDMSDEVQREASGVQSGLYQYDINSTWTPVSFDSPYLEFQALAAYTRGDTDYLFAGTATDGVFCSTDGCASWSTCNTNLANLMINSLFYSETSQNSQNTLYAGTTDGTIFRSLDDGQNWEQFSAGSIVEKVIEGDVVQEIRLVADGLPKMAIHALTASSSTLYAGTDNGVYQLSDDGVTWSPAVGVGEDKAPLSAVRALLVKGTQIFAGTSQGLFMADITASSLVWSDSDATLGQAAIHALATDGTTIWVATDDGIYQSDDDGDSWSLMQQPIPNSQTASALAFSNGQLLAVTPSVYPIADEWPGFTITNQQLDLDTVYDNVLPDSWVVLLNGQQVQPYSITQVTTEQGDDFTLHQKITRLVLSTDDGLDVYGGESLRSTQVLLQSEWLPLFEESLPNTEPLEGERIQLNGWVPPLEPGRRLVVSGQRIQVSISEKLSAKPLVASNESTKPLWAGQKLQRLGREEGDEAGSQQWTLKDLTGFIGVLEIEPGEEPPVYELAAETNEVVSEVCFVQEMTDDGQSSSITLRQPLKHAYDRNTVTIQANVVLATNGQTVANEVLGSGDGRQINQRFRLKKPPLTYVAAPTQSGIASTLTVRVNGIEWKEVPFFNQQDERSQCYIVRQDRTGQSTIIFGDGEKGARLPSGSENVQATYRSGIGLAGEVEANTLVILQTSPLGVLEVNNPVPATGAADAQTLQETSQNAPLTVLTMDRIVSLSDYEDFARTFAGIGKVEAALLWTNQGELIQLTIADTDGDAVEKGSALYDNLLIAINQRRNRLQQIEIDSYEPRFFRLEANLFYDSRYQTGHIQDAVKKTLLETFSFQKRAFGQDVAASEVMAIIQAVEGIMAVDLKLLYLKKETPALNELLVAKPARWSQEVGDHQAKIHAAQLLLIDADIEESIRLRWQES